jgi:YVTN family beta-propeller protein
VTKLSLTGAVLGTYATQTAPQGIAFDGANMWVANHTSDTVTKLQVSNGANLGTFNVGINPWGVVFDGANIWVVEQYYGYANGFLQRL